MPISLKTIVCPQCGASIHLEEDREKLFCSYCGAQIIVSNDNEHVYRHIDEADVQRAENEKIAMLTKISSEEKEKELAHKYMRIRIIASIILGIVAVITIVVALIIGGSMGGMWAMLIVMMLVLYPLLFIWIPVLRKIYGQDQNGVDLIAVPSGISNFKNQHYSVIADIMKNSGFTNVRCVPLNDLSGRNSLGQNNVSSIVINGQMIYSYGRRFPKDSIVYISYHSIAETNGSNIQNVVYSDGNPIINSLRSQVVAIKVAPFATESELYGQISKLSSSIINASKGNQVVLNSYEFYKLTMEYCLAMEDIAKRSTKDEIKVYLIQSAKKHAMYLRNEASLSNSANEQMRRACENYDKMIYDIQMK